MHSNYIFHLSFSMSAFSMSGNCFLNLLFAILQKCSGLLVSFDQLLSKIFYIFSISMSPTVKRKNVSGLDLPTAAGDNRALRQRMPGHHVHQVADIVQVLRHTWTLFLSNIMTRRIGNLYSRDKLQGRMIQESDFFTNLPYYLFHVRV